MVSTLRQRSYVARYEQHNDVLPMGGPLTVPIVEHVFEGVIVRTRAIPTDSDGRVFLVELSIEQRALEQPLSTVATEDGPTVDPVVSKRTVESRVSMTKGGLVVFGAGERGDEAVVVLMRIASVVPFGRSGPREASAALRPQPRSAPP